MTHLTRRAMVHDACTGIIQRFNFTEMINTKNVDFCTDQLIRIGKKATVKGGQFYLGKEAEGIMAQGATFFFENHDNERMVFYSLLTDAGYRPVKYSAPYDWTMTNGILEVRYCEGDIYVTAIDH